MGVKSDRFSVVVVVLTLTRIIKSGVTGQVPVTLELRNTPAGKTLTTQGGTRIYQGGDSLLYKKACGLGLRAFL